MTRRRGAVAAVVAVVAALALAGCGSSTGGARVAGASGDDTASYVQKAALDPCPTTTATTPGELRRLTLPCLGTGPAVDLSRLRGPALVNMWAQWCNPCVEEVPLLQHVHEAAKGRLLVLGVDIQEPSRRAPLSFAAAVGMHYPSVYDTDGAFRAAEQVPAPPATLFVDRAGRIVHRKVGLYRSAAELRADIARYLGVTV